MPNIICILPEHIKFNRLLYKEKCRLKTGDG
uniref:Uncharacterized protein n=1 Tax=Neisseria meningitidis alpha522 TaxID=996307 RepID=I4E3R9_NEIME|nr:hypothetical protein NMALPHA522_0442 [Neisseria meningitidis alpha522]